MSPDTKRKFVVVSHTHWDREWYQPFESFRARLVRMMDALIDLFERDPGFKHFVLDGQTVPLDDYLEIRPDRRETIERLVKEGRLRIGPNYMLPDEFLIGAEATIRNLMTGIRSAREYGRLMNVGYSPDAFGHIAHLPSVLRGFGIDSVLIWRGVGREVDVSEFRWQAPDGSEVMAVHFPYGYGYMATVPEDEATLRNHLQNVRSSLEPFATTSNVLVPNGTDHLPAHTGLSQVIARANKIMNDAEMVHGTYEEFIAAVRGELRGRYNELPLLRGEFRSSARSNVLAGVLSTRMWLKQRYVQCEDLLARYAEPLVAWAHLISKPDAERVASDKGLLHQAWKLLLQNGPHDSVTGCSVDAVYDDVGLRFEKCEQIAESLIGEAHGTLGRAAAPKLSETIVVFNPEAGPRTDFCTVQMPVEGGRLPTAFVEDTGVELPVQALRRGVHSPRDARERVVVGFVAPLVPAYGYKTFTVSYDERPDASHGGESSIENEYFHVSAQPDGRLIVVDKASHRTMHGLNRFQDSGEAGDEYTYNPPLRDEVIDAPKNPPQIRITETGPARWTLEVRQVYSLPARLTPDRKGRSDDRLDCAITSRVRLYPGVRRIDVETDVDNRCEDHRLRVLFPSGLSSERSYAEQHFGVVQRPAAPIKHDASWFETPANTHPQKTFVDLTNGQSGLMIANRGLPEYEILREDDGTSTVALTLLRCVSWLSREDLRTRNGHAGPMMYTPGAQMIGRWTFEYSIIPHEGDWQAFYQEAHRFNRPLRAIRIPGGAGELPREKPLLRLDGEGIALSTLKPAEDDDATVVRVYNISDHPGSAIISLREPISEVEAVDLNEENAGPVVVQGGAVRLDLAPNQIATFRFLPRK